jgi:hypothetical protein
VLRRLQTFLFSRRNIVGCALALGGLALAVIGLIPGLLWIPIVIALYAGGVLVTPADRAVAIRLDAQPIDRVDLRDNLDRLLIGSRGRVADDIYDSVASIRKSILATVDAQSAADVTDPNVFLVRQTAVDYLPSALQTYLRIPRAQAETVQVSGPATAHDVLLEQLRQMDDKLRQLATAATMQDSDQLMAHGRFIAQRFGTDSLDVDQAAVTQMVVSPATPAEGAASEVAISAPDVTVPMPEPAAGATVPAAVEQPESVVSIERERVR